MSTEVQACEGCDLPQPTSYAERRSETATCGSSIGSFRGNEKMMLPISYFLQKAVLYINVLIVSNGWMTL